MRYSLSVTTAPTAEPVSLPEAKRQCRIDGSDEDDDLRRLITAARAAVEAMTGRTLVTTTYAMTFDRFPGTSGRIVLPRSPVASVTSVAYRDTSSADTTLDPSVYKLSAGDVFKAGYLVPADGEVWPDTDCDPDAVTVTFSAGTAASAVPETVRRQVLLLVGHWWDRPETKGELPRGFERAFDTLTALNSVPRLA